MANLSDLLDWSNVGASMPEAYGANAPITDPIIRSLTDLVSLPKRAIDASADAYYNGNYNPGPILESAMLPMGGGVAGAPVKAGETALGAGPIRAYHGSPHDFDAFDMSKIGTGEGAQAYGHGLYFAESPGVAQSYRDNLSQGLATPTQARVPVGDVDYSLMDAGRKVGGVSQQRLDTLSSNITEALRMGMDPRKAAMDLAKNDAERSAAEAMLEAGKQYFPSAPGKMYEVNINADPEHFLDWDKPLSEQHPKVQDAVSKMWQMNNLPGSPSQLTGEGIHGSAVAKNTTYAMQKDVAKEAARQDLNYSGIPGIKYLDQGSRPMEDIGGLRQRLADEEKMLSYWDTPEQKAKWAGGPEAHEDFVSTYRDMASDLRNRIAEAEAIKPTHNYVVFDDKLVDIIKKYGMAGLSMLPPATAAAVSQRIKPVDHDPFEGAIKAPDGNWHKLNQM